MRSIESLIAYQRVAVTLDDTMWLGSAINLVYHIEQGGQQVRLYGRYAA